MNLDLLLNQNKLLQQKNQQHQNLLQFLLEKVHIKLNHRIFFHQVHQNLKVNLKVKHPMMNQVILHYQIILKQKQKQKLFLQQQQQQKNQLYHHHQFQKKLINHHHHQLLKLILKKSQQILNQSHHQRMILNNQN